MTRVLARDGELIEDSMPELTHPRHYCTLPYPPPAPQNGATAASAISHEKRLDQLVSVCCEYRMLHCGPLHVVEEETLS